MGALDGRVVIVTGAGRGIGREHALLMASEGAKLVINDLGGNVDGTGSDAGPAQEVVEEIKAMGGEAVANTDSVTDWEGGQRLINTAVEAFGDLHGLVNNAGILRDRVLVNMTEAEWDAVIAVDLKGHFVPSRWASAYWREKSKETGQPVKGSIVNTASGAMLGNPGQTNYTATKAGVAAMAEVWAKELARYGIRSGSIAPGYTRTDILSAMRPEILDKLTAQVPLRRLGEASEIASAAVFIVENDFFTGRCIDVDGGMRI